MDKSFEIKSEESELSASELQRYSRHIVIPEIGIEGQQKLKSAKVLLIGAGGLGSPAGMYLAAAGVGTIGIVEYDEVSYSNLQRQILFNTEDVGNSKAQIAKQRLNSLNPEIEIVLHETKLTKDNALGLIGNYDIVVDGSDNFATRYLVNDACVMSGKPFVSGSVLRFEGQVSFFDSTDGPCYRCLFPKPPAESPSCSDAGVLGVLPGIIGSLQANEVIKFIIGKGDLLIGRLLKLDALKMKFTELHFEKDLNCPECSENPLITELSNNDETFITKENQTCEITVEELKQKFDRKENFILLDVREPYEKEIADIGGVNIPFNSLSDKLDEFNKNNEFVVYCHVGARSYYAVEFMKDNGFKNVKNLIGGIDEWAVKIDSIVRKY